MRMVLAAALALSAIFAYGQATESTIRSESTVVLTPTLVLKKSGEIVHGLSANDFVIEDNGVEQDTRLDETPDSQSMSLVVAIQRGRSAYLELEPPRKQWAIDGPVSKQRRETTLSGLGTMVEGFVGESKSEVAVVTFDSKVELAQNFTEDVPAVAEKLGALRASGDGGAAILDAVAYSLKLLESRRQGHGRVLLLISEPRDHGSSAKFDEIVRRIALSNTVIYSVSFSPSRAETVRDIKGEDRGAQDLITPIRMAINGMKRNAARAIAELAGGESIGFTSKRTFDAQLSILTNHVRNRYLLSFQPKNPTPGPHSIIVSLRVPRTDAVVVARTQYWAAAGGSR